MSHTFGLELEVAGISVAQASRVLNAAGVECVEARPHGLHTSWSAVMDGSVNGAEVVSPILTAERLNDAQAVTRALLGAGGKVDRSTGYHVHIGARSLRYDNIANFIMNWYTAHDAIGALVAKSRLNNQYTKTLTIAQAERNAERVRGGNISDIHGDRYQSLNLMSFERHGTLEVRLHQGTLNGRKAVAWAEFIASLIDYSASNLLADVYQGSADCLYNCELLINAITNAGNLNPITADYLKRRAADLQGEA
jgi:hypothetical protein